MEKKTTGQSKWHSSSREIDGNCGEEKKRGW
jgi:hypothetical protein